MMPPWQALLWIKRILLFMTVMQMQSASSLEQVSYDGLKVLTPRIRHIPFRTLLIQSVVVSVSSCCWIMSHAACIVWGVQNVHAKCTASMLS